MRKLALVVAACCATSCGTSKPPSPTEEVVGCEGASLLTNPSDPAERGPWPVGARTVTIGDLTTEVWYPAIVGSEIGLATELYDIRKALPATEAAKIPDADNPLAPCDCVRGLPLDASHGPYPVVIFVHGTASFRYQSLHFATHWASRGFVVVAADHPGLRLADVLGMACGASPPPQALGANLDTLIAALASPAGPLDFLAGHIDPTRIAVSGHSAGGGAAAAASTKPGVQVVISMAGAMATPKAATLRSTLYFGGIVDSIASWGTVKNAWSGSPTPRRLIGISDGGHLTFSDLCQVKNAAGKDLLQIAKDHQVCGAQLAGFLFDCDPTHVDGPTGWDIVNHASSAVLETVLQCQPATDLSHIQSRFPAVADYQEAL